MIEWQIQQAKARLSEVIKKAAVEGPQRITVRGEPAAVVLSAADFERLKRPKQRFIEFMRASPLVGVELKLDREQTLTREIELS